MSEQRDVRGYIPDCVTVSPRATQSEHGAEDTRKRLWQYAVPTETGSERLVQPVNGK